MRLLRVAAPVSVLLGLLTGLEPGAAGQGREVPSSLPGAIRLAEGRFGKALDARATPVEVTGNPAFRAPPLTVECWAKLFTKDGFNVLVASDHKSSSRHWEIYTYAGTGRFAAYLPGVRPSEVVSDADVCDGKWHHLAMTYDGNKVCLFVDGKRVAEKSVRPREKGAPEPGPLTIGQAVVDIKDRIGCGGLIDEVRVSTKLRAITAAPSAPLPLDQETVGLWRFDLEDAADVDPAWTPRPALSDAPPWEKETDKDWVDGRLGEMDTGPFFDATVAYPGPNGPVRAFRGTAVRLRVPGLTIPAGAVVFDRNRLRMAYGWTGGYLKHSSRRFGLLNTPTPDGETVFTTGDGPGWADAEGKWDDAGPATGPLPREWGKYRGLYRNRDRVVFSYTVGGVDVLESPAIEARDETAALVRELEVGASGGRFDLLVCELNGEPQDITIQESTVIVPEPGGWVTALRATTPDPAWSFTGVGGKRTAARLGVAPHDRTLRFKVLIWRGKAADQHKFHALARNSPPPANLAALTRPGPRRWGESLVTQGVRAADDAAYVVDTLTIPYENPFKALFFVSGIDFLPDGRVAVCSAHGDVWLVGGVDETLRKLTWTRFATGLYQPLGLKVVGGKVIVLERGQLTRLHDHNGDGEADFYECFADGWHVGGGEHSFHTCLETDPQGNFYFFATGDTETPTGGCLMRVSKDGSRAEVFATGFRHPIGLGASPAGVITGADQEGNWMPATRIDVYRKGGFYGDMRAHHRKEPPPTFDPPLLWLPRQMDNSAGGQVWAPESGFGPLSGGMLHLSYGKCRMLRVLPQEVDGVMQAGAFDVGLRFLSGVARGRFRPQDGHLYVVGLDGWQTAAVRDGCLQRVRYTGKPVTMPVGLAVYEDGVRLTFSGGLDRAAAEDVKRWQLAQWNYRWSADYGSKRWSVAHPERVGADPVPVRSATLSPDGRSVFLATERLKPVMQMEVRYALADASGKPVSGVVCNTVHRPAPAGRP